MLTLILLKLLNHLAPPVIKDLLAMDREIRALMDLAIRVLMDITVIMDQNPDLTMIHLTILTVLTSTKMAISTPILNQDTLSPTTPILMMALTVMSSSIKVILTLTPDMAANIPTLVVAVLAVTSTSIKTEAALEAATAVRMKTLEAALVALLVAALALVTTVK